MKAQAEGRIQLLQKDNHHNVPKTTLLRDMWLSDGSCIRSFFEARFLKDNESLTFYTFNGRRFQLLYPRPINLLLTLGLAEDEIF